MIKNQTTTEMIKELDRRVRASLDLQRRINIATGLTAVLLPQNEQEDPDMICFALQAIANFTIAKVSCRWVPPKGNNNGWWRIGRLVSFDMADLRAAIDQ